MVSGPQDSPASLSFILGKVHIILLYENIYKYLTLLKVSLLDKDMSVFSLVILLDLVILSNHNS